MSGDFRKACLLFACDRCGVPAGLPCRTVTGNRSRCLHGNRYDQVQEVARLSGWMAEADQLLASVRTLRAGLVAIRGQATEEIRTQCDELLRSWY